MAANYSNLKLRVLGRPLATFAEKHERLGNPTALAVFASDAISSTAYAAEEILLVLTPVAGLAAIEDLIPIAIIVVLLLAIVTLSYRQTIFAYPNGGGSYIVSRENLGETPSLVAGAALLVDYVLTAAVSVSAGVAAITSAYSTLYPFRIEICLGFIALITTANLRGVRESGRLFAAPTYVYVVALFTLIAVGVARSYFGHLDPVPVNREALDVVTNNGRTLGLVTPFLLLRAFSSGAVALTGVEAISNGVPAFRRPESKNAARTLTAMSMILGAGFFGTALLVHRLHPTPSESETLLSIMGGHVFGAGSIGYYVLQFSTFAILVLAANTAFADFPRLASLIAADGFLPRQFANRGDRLVFSNGILVLAGAAAVLLIVFGGDTSALIPLYAVGVFAGFTLSQVGMVRHHLKLHEPNWRRSLVINAVGAVATGTVLLVVLISKFTIGAWIPAVLIPIIVVGFKIIREHYQRVARDLAVPSGFELRQPESIVVVLVGGVHRGTLKGLMYAKSLHPDELRAVTVAIDTEAAYRMRSEWDKYKLGVPLDVVPSPYRDLTRPVLTFLDRIQQKRPDATVTVVIPDYVVEHLIDNLLHNQSTLALTTKLRQRRDTVVVTVPVRRGESVGAASRPLTSPCDSASSE